MENFLLSPPIAMCAFLAISYGLYWVGGKLAARSQESPGKHMPYACGEDLLPPKAQLSYHTFFRLALMFGMLHLATLVISTLPIHVAPHRTALAYLLGIGVSVFVLTQRDP